jgi:hypothetical protein
MSTGPGLMLKGSLSHKHNGYRGLSFVTDIDGLVVPHGVAGVDDGLDTLAQGPRTASIFFVA